MSSAAESAEALRKEAAQKLAEAERLTRLQARFPDLRKHVGRWNKVAYCSKSVNPLAEKYESRHNCGCCNDSPLEVWPYVETEDGRVYSDPPMFFVGERHWMGGDTPSPGWRESLQKAGIPQVVIDGVAAHFRSDREDRIESASADGDDYSEDDSDGG